MPTRDPVRDALYSAILDDPDEDGPRLVFADWLEEHGDRIDLARAEFIRLQCRLARMSEWDEGVVEARARAERLRAEHHKDWTPEGPDGKEWAFSSWHYDRGFVASIRLADSAEPEARHWFARLPITRAQFFYRGWANQSISVNLLDAPGIADRIRQLSLDSTSRPVPAHVVDAGWEAISRCSHLSNLRRIWIGEDPPSPSGLTDLLASPLCRRLRRLSAWGDNYRNDLLARLASVDLPELSDLRLGRELTPEGAATLAKAPWLSQLTALDLTANANLGDDGLTALLAGAGETIRSLELWSTGLGGSSWSALAEHGPASLVHLNIGHNHGAADEFPRIGEGKYKLLSLRSTGNVGQHESGVAPRMFSGPALAGLRRLEWVGNYLGTAGLAALAQAPFRESMRFLVLKGRNNLGEDMSPLLGVPWPNLAHLDLASNPLSPETALALVEHPNLSRLASLTVTIPDRAHVFLKGLAKSPAAARLRALHLICALTSGAVTALVKSPWLDDLEYLFVHGLRGSDERRRLEEHFGPRMHSEALFS